MALDPLGIIFWLVFLGILSGGCDAAIKQGLLALHHTKGQPAAACIGAHDDLKELGRAQTSPLGHTIANTYAYYESRPFIHCADMIGNYILYHRC